MAENDLRKRWDIHLVSQERISLTACLDNVLVSIKNSDLDLTIQKMLLRFYTELKAYYNDHDLINDAALIKEYTESYLTNHSMHLIYGVLAAESPAPKINNEVEKELGNLLHDSCVVIRQQSASFLKALGQVEQYSTPHPKKLDEDFYADDAKEDYNRNRIT